MCQNIYACVCVCMCTHTHIISKGFLQNKRCNLTRQIEQYFMWNLRSQSILQFRKYMLSERLRFWIWKQQLICWYIRKTQLTVTEKCQSRKVSEKHRNTPEINNCHVWSNLFYFWICSGDAWRHHISRTYTEYHYSVGHHGISTTKDGMLPKCLNYVGTKWSRWKEFCS